MAIAAEVVSFSMIKTPACMLKLVLALFQVVEHGLAVRGMNPFVEGNGSVFADHYGERGLH